MLALKLNTSGEILMQELRSESCPMLDFCYASIKCECIEVVHPKRLPYPYVMIVDESGLLKELPVNPLGSILYEADKHGYPIVGTALIMKQAMTEDGPDIVSLDEGDIEPIRTNINIALREFSLEGGE